MVLLIHIGRRRCCRGIGDGSGLEASRRTLTFARPYQDAPRKSFTALLPVYRVSDSSFKIAPQLAHNLFKLNEAS